MPKRKKINQEKFEEIIKKIGNPENYHLDWEEGNPKFKLKKKISQGKISKEKGRRFELKVRRDLETKGRFVDKWNNNVDLVKGELIIAKRKYNPFSKVMTIGTGFPDFVSFRKIYDKSYSVIGVEVKINGILSKVEKEKCKWYLKKEIFSEIWIAKAIKNGRKIEVKYENFKERYLDKKFKK